MKLIATALIFAACALPAGDPPGFFAWKSAALKAFTKSLAPKINEQKVATQQLGLIGNYSAERLPLPAKFAARPSPVELRKDSPQATCSPSRQKQLT
jgi:hypothetical protein